MALKDTAKKISNLFGKKPPLREEGKARGLWSGWLNEFRAVQDDLTDKKGTDVYLKMRIDPDVKTGLLIKSCAVLSKGWSMSPAVAEGSDGYESAVEQMEFVQDCFDSMPGSLDDVLEEVIGDALTFGTSPLEKCYVLRSDGRIGYAALKPKNPQLYSFKLDDFNNITGLLLILGGERIELDPAKFAFFAYNAQYGEPWGTSDLRTAYFYWWLKRKFWEWWAIYLEKYGMPIVRGTFSRGTPKDEQDALLAVLDKLQNETALVHADDQTVEFMLGQAAEKGNFQEAIDACSRQIVKAILGQTLSTEQGQEGRGSYAAAKVHQDIFGIYIRRLKRQAEEYVDEQIVRNLIDYNFVEPMYPNFSLSLDETDIGELSEVVFRLVQAEVLDPEIDQLYIRELLGIPARTQEQQAASEQRKAEGARVLEGLESLPEIGAGNV